MRVSLERLNQIEDLLRRDKSSSSSLFSFQGTRAWIELLALSLYALVLACFLCGEGSLKSKILKRLNQIFDLIQAPLGVCGAWLRIEYAELGSA